MNAASFPNVGTMESRVLAVLLSGVSLTHRDFWTVAGTYRLSGPIYLLRQRGWLIEDKQESVPTSDPTKRRAHVKRYRLSVEAVRVAGEDGRDFVRNVREWERLRASGMAGTVAAAPAVKAAGNLAKVTDRAQRTTGAA